ncbi:hypothetical protein G3I60_28415 [Streptomyces sp. SID13666]|uniref:hypothetical protein n=1 Tax=unclassified Streptomyces TaxID=2593676 RepID=UPI0013BF45BF|nr:MULTISPECIES: hypothetical protein [unclassified Streptomyces]NEA57978.1 hypothetical protein [Streptomyces sp. SID13666]NEA72836.1 hypothetical protein [Streptomyces sp. SID13588]
MIGPIVDFPHLLKQITPHISADTTLPVINGVRFEADATHLYAIATDRYTMAVTRRPVHRGTAAGWSAFVSAADLKAVRSFATLTRMTPLFLDLSAGGQCLSFTAGAMALAVPTVNLSGARRIDWRTFIADAMRAVPNLTTELDLNPTFLGRWGSAARNVPLTVWGAGPTKPLLIACGDDFVGLQMPVQNRDTKSPSRQSALHHLWADALTTAPAVQRAA